MTDAFILLLYGFALAAVAALALTVFIDLRLKRSLLIRTPVDIVVWVAFTIALGFVFTKLMVLSVPKPAVAGNAIDFDQLPLARKIQIATVIAVGEHRMDNGMLRTYITEVLKRDPRAAFPYTIGDQYPHQFPSDFNRAQFGDGEVMFFVGGQATLRQTLTISANKVLALDDMQLQVLRDEVARQTGAGRQR
ncbi:MAG: hypothetical protein M3Z31_08590 [Pseudomonadota bacterium]|nr:hypothetical protein [Pseudomonadota bacterium]